MAFRFFSRKHIMRQIIAPVIGALWWFCAPIASAENLRDALEAAYENSELLEQNRAVLRASDEDYIALAARLRPVISYAFSSTKTVPRPSSQTKDITSNLSLSARWKLFDFGITKTTKQSAAVTIAAARQTLLSLEQTVLFTAAKAYFDYQSALENLIVAENSVHLITEHLAAAKKRYALGKITQTDIAQAEARLAKAVAQKVTSQGRVTLAGEAYRLAIGTAPPQNLVNVSLAELPFNTQSAVIEAAFERHPKFKAKQFLAKARAIGLELSAKARYPSLELSTTATNNVNGKNKTNNSIGLTLSGTIYSGGAFESAQRKALAQYSAEMAALRYTSKEIEQQGAQAWSNYAVAQQSLKAAQEEVRANEIAYQGARVELGLGARTTLDVLNAEQELLSAKTKLITAKTALNIAYYSVLSAAGHLTVEAQNLDVVAYDPDENFNLYSQTPYIDALELESTDDITP